MRRTKNRKMLKRLSSLVCLALIGSLQGSAEGATAADFETPEYRRSAGLSLIRAADAYAAGYTGSGITLGIADSYVQLTHYEFRQKTGSATVNPVPSGYIWTGDNDHGTHVGGIMAAAKDDEGMHGAAYNANLLSGDVLSDPQNVNLRTAYNTFAAKPAVKVINNSWGSEAYIDIIGKQAYSNNKDFQDTLNILQDSITKTDKVLVFAAGNDGHPTPEGEPLLPYLRMNANDDAYKTGNTIAGNFISVVSVNPAADIYGNPLHYTVSGGKISAAGIAFVSEFSDLTKYVHENSIAAPGSSIYSTISNTTSADAYEKKSGTSMAAPHVSGVAGLVQQAFPYMTGKQIVDTVLSTANNTFALPAYTVTVQTDGPSDPKTKKVNLYYLKPPADIKEPHKIDNEADLTAYYNANSANLPANFLTLPRVVYTNVPRELIFGQGLLDAAAAVKGPALLDARRLTAADRSEVGAFGQTQALYELNTRGYNTTWSNNIGERRAGFLAATSAYQDLRDIYAYYSTSPTGSVDTYSAAQGLAYINEYNERVKANKLIQNVNNLASEGLPVGLYKSGPGTLTLIGTNTYLGSTISAGGTIEINGSVAGDAWSWDTGIIAGTGTIKGNLNNYYNIRAGSGGQPGTLTVNGNLFRDASLVSNSYLSVAIDNNDNYGKIEVKGSATITGTLLIPYTDAYKPEKSYAGVLKADGGITGTFADMPVTPFLTAVGQINGNSVTLAYRVENNFSSLTPMQKEAYDKMMAIYNAQPANSQTRRDMYSLLNLQGSTANQALADIRGGAQLDTTAAVQSDTFIGSAVAARLDSLRQGGTGTGSASLTLMGFAPGLFGGNTIIPLGLDTQNSWWVKATKNWGSIDAQTDTPATDNRSFGLVVGRDKQTGEHWRAGYLLGYGQNKVSSRRARTDTHGYRMGAYAGYSYGPLDMHTYLDYGRHSNKAQRYITSLGQADSDYASRTLSFGVSARYNLHHGTDALWQVSPYADFLLTRYTQNGYTETGSTIYNQTADPLANTYSTGEIGIELGRRLPKGRYALSVGYKKVLSGSNPAMTVAYTIDPNDKIRVSGGEQDSEYLVLGLNLQGEVGKNWTVDTQITSEHGRRSQSLTAAVTLRKVW